MLIELELPRVHPNILLSKVSLEVTPKTHGNQVGDLCSVQTFDRPSSSTIHFHTSPDGSLLYFRLLGETVLRLWEYQIVYSARRVAARQERKHKIKIDAELRLKCDGVLTSVMG